MSLRCGFNCIRWVNPLLMFIASISTICYFGAKNGVKPQQWINPLNEEGGKQPTAGENHRPSTCNEQNPRIHLILLISLI